MTANSCVRVSPISGAGSMGRTMMRRAPSRLTSPAPWLLTHIRAVDHLARFGELVGGQFPTDAHSKVCPDSLQCGLALGPFLGQRQRERPDILVVRQGAGLGRGR